MSVYDFSAIDINGNEQSLADYQGKVLLLVNVASACGLTPHYKGLEALQKQYSDQGLTVLGFPCNQFGAQEPGAEAEIATFCETKFDVTFPLFSKIEVNGENSHPLYQYLKDPARGLESSGDIEWNFAKFLIGRDGEPTKRYAPTVEPKDIAADIEALL